MSRLELVREAAREIRKADRVLLACHVRPDGDALGSLIGLARALEAAGKQVDAVSPDGVPELYRFLPDVGRVRTAATGAWDLAVGLDADGPDRLGSAEALVLAQPVVIDIDHHTGPDPYGDVRLVDRTAAATGELVFELLEELNAPIDRETAVCLLTAVLTDTGSYRFSNVTPRVFEISAELVRLGAHPQPIYEAVYGVRPYKTTLLLGRVLQRVETTAGGRVAWSYMDMEDIRAVNADPDLAEGIVDQIGMVAGAETALFFREEPDGGVRVNLRSRRGLNVAAVAEQFGGGGHAPAAGCTLHQPMQPAIRMVLDAVVKQMENRQG